MKIQFTTTIDVANNYPPIPASQNVPDWYKKTPSYLTEDGSKKPALNGTKTGTIKRCMPVFDAMSNGYLILLAVDVYVHKEKLEDGTTVQSLAWASSGIIEFHPIEQASLHPVANPQQNIPKFMNPWIIKTPKGYSSLFVPPMHRSAPFEILPGLVDTDVYNAAVNFPFIIKDTNFDGLIPAGTPIAQLIPVKRDSWKSTFGGEKELKNMAKIIDRIHGKFFDGYKTLFRQPKEYK